MQSVEPGPQQRQGAANGQLAFEFMESQIEARGKELARHKAAWKTDSATKECPVRGGTVRCSAGAVRVFPRRLPLQVAYGGCAARRAACAEPRLSRAAPPQVEFMAYEASLFSLDMHDTLSTVYSHPLSAGNLDDEELEAVREKVCARAGGGVLSERAPWVVGGARSLTRHAAHARLASGV